jgi:hypothetical protein
VADASEERITMGIAPHQELSRFGYHLTDCGDLEIESGQVTVPQGQTDLMVDCGKRRNTDTTVNHLAQKMDLHLEKEKMYQHI